MTNVRYVVTVYGKFWNGMRGEYEYTQSAPPQNRKEVERLAGDFESVISFSVDEVTTEVTIRTLLEG